MADEKRSVSISANNMQLSEFKRQDWICDADYGHTIEDALKPEYWAHVASQLRPWDHIELRAEDGSWMAEFMVLFCERTYAKVHLKQKYMLTTQDVSLTQAAAFDIAWSGPAKKFRVIRKSDKAVLKDGFATQTDASVWVSQNEMNLA